MPVSVEKRAPIAVVTIDNPPVNATSHAVRKGLMDALSDIENDRDVSGVILACSGRTFVAGADIREFGKPSQAPVLPGVIAAIEGAKKPWLAAIHGTAFGGGFELALACAYRIARQDAKVGFPEVTLGLIPGAGGTVRLPRLVAAEDAVDLIAGGKPITAPNAEALGLIDLVVEDDLESRALEFLESSLNDTWPEPLIARQPLGIHDQSVWDTRVAQIKKRARGQNSPLAAIKAVENALAMDAAQALASERETFLRLRDDPQSNALRYVFFAERETTKMARIRDVTPAPVTTVAVVGGGTMGAGIAAACLLNGLAVRMIEQNTEAAEAGQARVLDILANSRARGLIAEKDFEEITERFVAGTNFAAAADANLAIEAVFEDLSVKQDVFLALEPHMRREAILASNTSYLDVNAIADAVEYPDRVVGLHFFSPAHIMKLLEIIVPDRISDRTLATAVGFAKTLRKTAVLAGVCEGFIANRIMSAYRRECDYMLEDGALPWQIDRAMTNFGMPMGIYQMQDLAGLDISWAMRKRLAATRPATERYVGIGDRLCEMGRFGYKSGRGYYKYGSGQGQPDPEVEALIITESRRKGIKRVEFSEGDIMRRILATMQAEGQCCLDEGIARSADDIDVAMVNAFGFPRWKGGPMYLKSRQYR